MATTERFVQTRTPAPTFGELFAGALSRNIGRPAREFRTAQQDFLKIAPAGIQQGILGFTSPDDPEAIQFGNKPFTVGGQSFKRTTPQVSDKEFFETALLRQELLGGGQASEKALNDYFFSDFGPALEVRGRFSKKLKQARKSKDPGELLRVETEMNQELSRAFSNFFNAFRGNSQSIVFGTSGTPQFLVTGSDGSPRPATLAEQANGLKGLTVYQPTGRETTKELENLEDKVDKGVGQAAKDLFSSVAQTENKAFAAGELFGKGIGSIGQEALRLPSRAAGVVAGGANLATDFTSGLLSPVTGGFEFGKIDPAVISALLRGGFSPESGPQEALDFINTNVIPPIRQFGQGVINQPFSQNPRQGRTR